MRKQCKLNVVAIAVFSFCCSSPQALAIDSLIKQAKTSFDAWNYGRAEELCQEELAKNPNSADAHYLLGNIMVKWNRTPEALAHFEKAAKLDPKGMIGQYSKQYAASLKYQSHKQSTKSFATTESNDKKSEPPAPVVKLSAEEQARMKAASAIHESMSKKTDEITAQQDKEIKRIEEETDAQISDANKSTQAKISENGQPIFSGARLTYNPETLNQPLREQLARQINFLRAEGLKRIEVVKALYRAKLTATEDAATTLHQSYQSKNQQGKIILSPVGTNMHVHSYQTSDEPSHDEVPLVAEPRKELKGAKGK